MDPLTALAVQAGSQAVGAGLGKLLGRMNRVDPNDAYNDAPQHQEYSPMLQQSAIERGRIGGRVDNRRESVLARILAQANSAAPMSANSSRNVAAANAQTSNMMNTIAGVEQNLDGYESQLEGRANDMEMQGRSRLAEIMQLNSMARQQAAQQARLANRQQSAAGMATGLQLGSTMGSGIVNYSAMRENLKFQKEQLQENRSVMERLFGSTPQHSNPNSFDWSNIPNIGFYELGMKPVKFKPGVGKNYNIFGISNSIDE